MVRMAYPDKLNSILNPRSRSHLRLKDGNLNPSPIARGLIIGPALVMRLCNELQAIDSFDRLKIKSL
jgi:hypothetical protein